jgi:hypothetical protein
MAPAASDLLYTFDSGVSESLSWVSLRASNMTTVDKTEPSQECTNNISSTSLTGVPTFSGGGGKTPLRDVIGSEVRRKASRPIGVLAEPRLTGQHFTAPQEPQYTDTRQGEC